MTYDIHDTTHTLMLMLLALILILIQLFVLRCVYAYRAPTKG